VGEQRGPVGEQYEWMGYDWEEYTGSKIVVKYFFSFPVGQELPTRSKEVEGGSPGALYSFRILFEIFYLPYLTRKSCRSCVVKKAGPVNRAKKDPAWGAHQICSTKFKRGCRKVSKPRFPSSLIPAIN
jgi:hypothetical protein